MLSLSLPHRWPRGPENDLHDAATEGLVQRTLAILTSGRYDIDLSDPLGWTPLANAAYGGHLSVVQVLLHGGADTSIANDEGFTPLHIAAQNGHPGVANALVEAGADLEARTNVGSTPLTVAAGFGRTAAMRVLIEAGADVDSPRFDGATPMLAAALTGRTESVVELLGAGANPVQTMINQPSGGTYVPLCLAAKHGHVDLVRELIQRLGIEGCGGPTGGENALMMTLHAERVDIMAMLAGAGVVDRVGEALLFAARSERPRGFGEGPAAPLRGHDDRRRARLPGRSQPFRRDRPDRDHRGLLLLRRENRAAARGRGRRHDLGRPRHALHVRRRGLPVRRHAPRPREAAPPRQESREGGRHGEAAADDGGHPPPADAGGRCPRRLLAVGYWGRRPSGRRCRDPRRRRARGEYRRQGQEDLDVVGCDAADHEEKGS